MTHFMLRRHANAQNPNKVQRTGNSVSAPTGFKQVASSLSNASLPRKFQHASDISARVTQARSKQREHDRSNLEIPANRIYDVVNVDVGYDHSRVTLSGNSAIVWDAHSQQWVPATYAAPEVATNKLVRVVRASNGNRQAGGNF
jgi:hypothetical protein